MVNHDPIQSLVRKVERRLTLQRRLATSSKVIGVGLAVSLSLCIGMQLVGTPGPLPPMAWLPFLAGLLGALAIHLGAIPRVPLGAAALHIDDRLHLNDRITTHITVPPASSAFLDLVRTQALSALRSRGRETTPGSLVSIVLPTTSVVLAIACCLLAAPLVVMTRSPFETRPRTTPGVEITAGWGPATGTEPGSPPGSSPASAADVTSSGPSPAPSASPRAQAQHLLQALQAGNIRILEAKPQAARIQHDLTPENGLPMDPDDQQLMDALQSILDRVGAFREPGATSPGGDTGMPTDDHGPDAQADSVRTRGNGTSETGSTGPQGQGLPAPTPVTPRWTAAATLNRSSALPPRLSKIVELYFQGDDKE